MPIQCFWLEPTDRQKRYLRRYNGNLKCTGPMSYHDAMTFVDESREVMGEVHGSRCWVDDGKTAADFKGHPLWPTHCVCGYEFQENDEWQLFGTHIYRRATGEETTLRDAPEGAMWDATWFHDHPGWCGPDGRSILCKVPTNHDWHIDGPCSNCTRPNEPHKCWVRHGEPPNLTVDKNGDTCAAGAGSILTRTWHGFLRNGELITA
jgi:hypothetical protein